MGELAERRGAFFRGAGFKTALFYSGDGPGGCNASFRYFAGCEIDGSYLVLRPEGGRLLAHGMNYRMARAASHYPVKLLGRERAKGIRSACGRGKVGVVGGEMPASRYLALKKHAKLRLVEADAKALEARGFKSKSEIGQLEKSAKIARGILEGLRPWEHGTEESLAAHLKMAALETCAEISFEPIVATGSNAAFPHHRPGAKKLQDAVLVDFGVKYRGYCSDFTRCYFRGKRGKEREAYEKCEAVFWQMLEGLPECRKGKDVAALSEKLMKKRGLPPLVHSIGHGIGLEVHEYPHLGKKSSDKLGVGSVLAIEPAAYFSNYGARFEEMAARTKKGWRIL
jgi:Xaa-Pro aminopeptidase